MEEHYQAYFAWKARGIDRAWCWHVDAHLDIGDTGLGEQRLATLKECTNSQEALERGCLGNSYLPWGGLHCGNYLYPAIKEGLVGKLTWVIPPDLPEPSILNWAKHHLNEWIELSPDEYRNLETSGDRVSGTLLGIPFEMGPLESLSLPQEPVLLDIDIDYFLEEDGTVWQESSEFARLIKGVPSALTTVAYSVKGGFTPELERRLADPFLQGESVQDLGEPYKERDLDHLAALVRCHRHEEALELLSTWEAPGVEANYLKGTSLHALKRYEDTLALWEQMLDQESLTPDGLTYLHNLCSELNLSLERPEECLKHAQVSQRLDRKAYAPYWMEALAREKLGDWQKMVKALRRASKLSEEKILGLRARVALVRLYRKQGKEGLARVEDQRLKQIDPTGRLRAFALMGL